MENKTKMLPEQQKDFITATVISAIACGLLYYFLFKPFMDDLFHLRITTQVIIIIFAWMVSTGGLIGTIARNKAHQKIAYGK